MIGGTAIDGDPTSLSRRITSLSVPGYPWAKPGTPLSWFALPVAMTAWAAAIRASYVSPLGVASQALAAGANTASTSSMLSGGGGAVVGGAVVVVAEGGRSTG